MQSCDTETRNSVREKERETHTVKGIEEQLAGATCLSARSYSSGAVHLPKITVFGRRSVAKCRQEASVWKGHVGPVVGGRRVILQDSFQVKGGDLSSRGGVTVLRASGGYRLAVVCVRCVVVKLV